MTNDMSDGAWSSWFTLPFRWEVVSDDEDGEEEVYTSGEASAQDEALAALGAALREWNFVPVRGAVYRVMNHRGPLLQRVHQEHSP